MAWWHGGDTIFPIPSLHHPFVVFFLLSNVFPFYASDCFGLFFHIGFQASQLCFLPYKYQLSLLSLLLTRHLSYPNKLICFLLIPPLLFLTNH